MVCLSIEGHQVEAPANCSILQAFVHAGQTLVQGVGCMGQGVCGSCRVMVRRSGEQEVKTALACETLVEDGMQVAFLDYFTASARHAYRIEDIGDSWQALRTISEIFPEAAHCRHCSGCDRACPKGLDVQRGVKLAVEGKLAASSEVFDECVMCNLCTLACPEHIRPNHLGLFVRRMIAAVTLRPANLMRRLQQIESGEMKIDFDAPGAHPPR
ncbi:2Fe-2S iron-sulfur cluster binding domain-containing protein [Caballeronia arationis]|jgi:succinate dehydrogenase/fumarate reductase-like Fe-S protein|uniref:2Fe-2S iron-sulfur cluster binding domain-containing protein n=1 Tax=Caballeronia arationis TaxID=1777142 RepID=A0A7Z7N6Z7_9BURK|nr:4Fe-4S dicluster domain-containing protein [Caballeronia arationis]SOE89470.1 2Fe-2S iron-sulfur cluster binding domain-containing protein [Caballeronia arationis]